MTKQCNKNKILSSKIKSVKWTNTDFSPKDGVLLHSKALQR